MNEVTNSSSPERGKSLWGIGIAALYTVFALSMISLAIYVSTIEFELVEDDYYARQIDYQSTIDAVARAKALRAQPILAYDSPASQIALVMPKEFVAGISGGEIAFTRPSDKSADTTVLFPAQPTDGVIIDSDRFITGLWNVTVSWRMNGELYVMEYSLFIE